MKKGLFKRIFILYVVILVAAALFIELYVTDTIRENYVAAMRENLSIQAGLLADRISFQASRPEDGLCRQLKAATGARVTIIAKSGRVLGDSETDSTGMENHGHRPEILQADLNGIGMSIRHSHTLNYDLLYVAKKLDRGFVRLSVPLTEVDRAVNELRFRIILVVILILLATAVVSLWQMDRIRRLTERIRNFSRSLAAGDLGSKLYLERAGEFDEIAESLNAMSRELKNSIAAHEDEQRRLNVILRNIPDALFIIDSRGMILLSSVAARELFGDAPFSGRPYVEVVRNSEFLALMEEARREQKQSSAEIRLDFPHERFCVVQVSPLFYEKDAPSGFVIVFHDITKLKKLEQVRQDFVANLSHELKTPVTAITGFTETLLEGALDDRRNAVKFLETIKANSERINSLVDDLMTISKLEQGVTRLKKTVVGLPDVAEQVATMLRDKAAKKNLALAIRLLPSRTTVEADRDRIIQILTNLVDNAIKFTERGGVTFGSDEMNGRLFLFVEDTGIGVAKQHLNRLGERFYRVDPGRSRNMGGTGLGLAIVKHLVKAQGWEMRIESAVGKGTLVTILVE